MIDEYVELTESLIDRGRMSFEDYLEANNDFYDLSQMEIDGLEVLPFGNLPELVDWKLEQIKKEHER